MISGKERKFLKENAYRATCVVPMQRAIVPCTDAQLLHDCALAVMSSFGKIWSLQENVILNILPVIRMLGKERDSAIIVSNKSLFLQEL